MNYRWKRTFSLPSRLKTSVLNYLNFFREYIAATDEIRLDVEYHALYQGEQTRIEVAFVMESEHLQARVTERLRDYMNNIFRDPAHDFAPEFYTQKIHTQKSEYEAELLLVLYRRALADIRTDIRFHHNLLPEDERKSLIHALALLSMHADVTEMPLHSLSEHAETSIEGQIQTLHFPSEKEQLTPALQNALTTSNTSSLLAQRAYSAADYIQELALQAHPEGGYFRETYRSDEDCKHLPTRFTSNGAGGRAFSTAIYFLLEQGHFSALHRIQSDEIWHFYDGSPLVITCIAPNGALSEIRLGRNLKNGEVVQTVVPKGWWFGTRLAESTPPLETSNDGLGRYELGTFGLVGCTVAPGFDFADFEMPSRARLLQLFPQHRLAIEQLTKPDTV
jgi:uncharacterized protein